MRSKIIKEILSKTPDSVSEKVFKYSADKICRATKKVDMKKTLEQMLKEPHNIGVADIAEYVCTGYDKNIFEVIRLLDAYVESVGKNHKRELDAKDFEIRRLEAKIRRLTT